MNLRLCLLGSLAIAGGLVLGGCGKKAPETPVSAASPTPSPTPTPKPTPPEDPLTTRVGFFIPQSGFQASFGEDALKGAQLAEKEINAAGGLFGHPFKLVVRDTESKTEVTATTVKDLVEKDHVVALIGEIASDRSLVAAPIAQGLGIPMLTPAATHQAVTEAGDCIFRICYTDAFQAAAMSKFAKSIDAQKAAVLYDAGSLYSADLANIFKADFTKGGGQIVAEATYRTGDRDYSAQLNAIKAQNPEVVFLPSYYTEAALIISQARQFGLDMPFLGTDGWDSPEFLRVGGDAVKGTYFSSHFAAENKAPNVENFVQAYTAAYGAAPPPLAALAYDSVILLADALKRAGNADPIPLKQALAQTKDFPGVTGAISFDEKRNPTKPAIILRVQDGKFTYLETSEPR